MELIVIKISGSVQGVNFRYYAWRTANDLEIKGFVRNELDGTVYCEAQGEKKNLEQFLAWCRTGPPLSKVTNVKFSYEPMENKYDDFNIKY